MVLTGCVGANGDRGSLLVALASAAQVARDFGYEEEHHQNGKPSGVADGDETAELVTANPHITPEGRLASALEVNRLLHNALAAKKGLLSKSQEEITHLDSLLERSAVEQPARRSHIDEMQAQVQVSEPSGKAGRENKQMLRDIAKLEAKIGKANDDNLICSEKHRVDRARMVEQQARLRTLGKRERELAKHLDYLATKLNEAVAALSKEHKEQANLCIRLDLEEEEIESLPADFRNIAGMRLNKLVGNNPDRPPPALVLKPGASVPELAPTAAPPAPELAPAETTVEVQNGGAEVDTAGSVACDVAATAKEEEL